MPKGIFKNPAERAEKIRQSRLGKKRPPLTEEWKRKIGESCKKAGCGKFPKSDETKAKIREARLKQVFSEESKEKSKAALVPYHFKKGIEHPLWKGGKTSENNKIRASKRYARWRKKVFERDDYTCVECSARNGNGKNVYLEADHIKPFCDYPELIFEVNNGRTLCKECHKKTPNYGRKKGYKNE